jgi:hypothetical protein
MVVPTATRGTIRIPRTNIVSAQLCSGVEDNLRGATVENNAVQLMFRPFEVLTVRVVIK